MGTPGEGLKGRPEGFTESDLLAAGRQDQLRGVDRPKEIFPQATLDKVGVEVASKLLAMPGALEEMLRTVDLPKLVADRLTAVLTEISPEALIVIARDPEAVLSQIVEHAGRNVEHAAYSQGSIAEATVGRENIQRVFGDDAASTEGAPYQC